jgi:acyl-coenzyme A synthetase/AMP-(fatty) acid ligase
VYHSGRGSSTDNLQGWWSQPFDDSWTIANLIARTAAFRSADGAILKDNGDWISFGNIYQRGSSLASILTKNATTLGRNICCLTTSSEMYYAAIIAGSVTGSRIALLDPLSPPDRIKSALDDAEVSSILVDADSSQLITSDHRRHRNLIRIDQACSQNTLTDSGFHLASAPANNRPEFIIFTSGSTGRPKGVIRSELSMLHAAHNYASRFEFAYRDVVLYVGSPGHVGTLNDVLLSLLSGHSSIPLRPDRIDIHRIVDLLNNYNVNKLVMPPSLLRLVFRGFDTSNRPQHITMVVPSGEPLLRSDIRLLFGVLGPDVQVWQSYGSTEAGHISSGWYSFSDVDGVGPLPLHRVADGVRIDLVDLTGNEVEENQTGIIRVRSNYLSSGYIQTEPEEAARFGFDERGRYYNTGDRARRNPDGSITIEGRQDRQIGIAGQRLELGDIESAAMSIQGWAEASATFVQNNGAGGILVLLACAENGWRLSADELKASLRQKLPRFAVPRHIFLLEQLPRTLTGKVDLNEVNRLAHEWVQLLSTAASAPQDQPAGATENWIADAWQYCTRATQRPGRDIRFDDYGGDSIHAIALAMEICKQFGLSIGLDFVAEFITVEAQARAVDLRRSSVEVGSETVRIVPLRTSEDGPVFVFVPGIGGHAWVYRSIARELNCSCTFASVQMLVSQKGDEDKLEASHVAAVIRNYFGSIGPNRPLILGGYSFGALVAADVFNHLQKNDLTIHDLILIDPSGTSRLSEWRRNFNRFKQLILTSKRIHANSRRTLDREVRFTALSLRHLYAQGDRVLPAGVRCHLLQSVGNRSAPRLLQTDLEGRTVPVNATIIEGLTHLDLMREGGARAVANWIKSCVN